jgi:hypothetical protein
MRAPGNWGLYIILHTFMKREDVYKLLDLERRYQDEKWNGDSEKSVAEWLIYIERHLNAAKKHVYVSNYSEALEQIRKIAGIGIACMEYNETRARKND